MGDLGHGRIAARGAVRSGERRECCKNISLFWRQYYRGFARRWAADADLARGGCPARTPSASGGTLGGFGGTLGALPVTFPAIGLNKTG
ncbi:uncharacterized protein AruCF_0696 [Achromobacter ruhlandii]|nr:uncharacterized protein AruCF_0696 [Achromobacter ruhlandii]